ncbi:hypothetical protein PC9H_004748 [Pleurotus ostreatus]|uniref:Protein YOP1 n=2 Tax=Pleurotus ostreatus TaxID=5322 RepID=A0A8H7DUW5_PLEOS|nr:uncharacterized protein PC9H_004748 [Pleurotus ostreatus]KAF7432805.1 hypothetical protein PC9H_004748 [Pleurotus ostreatus]KAJ8698640.1 hypothetical protein PTI98_005327 [Pleurotus ostreatus]
MPLVVPLLRIVMVFLNVYDSFKTLKAPPISSRTGGRSSIRGKTQRKRDMKGCLAVWVVWCCFVSYERFLERVVSLFIPFYDEMKSLVMLFLILTRARGAEPIYLHVIRPLLKPYTSTLDICLDLVCMIGDMIFTAFMMPIHLCLPYWNYFFGNGSEATGVHGAASTASLLNPATHCLSVESNGHASKQANKLRPPASKKSSRSLIVADSKQPTDLRRYPASEITRAGNSVRSQTAGAGTSKKPTALRPKNSRVASQPQPQPRPRSQRKTSGSVSEPQPAVWQPSAAYQDSDEEVRTSAPSDPTATPQTPAHATTVSGLPVTAEEQTEEWRKYPPLPSAYPPTPLVVAAPLTAATSDKPASDGVLPIIEEPSEASDNEGHVNDQEPALEPEEDISSDEDDSDQDFDATMRTPRKNRLAGAGVYNDDAGMASSASSSSSSIHSRSTTLDTIDNASSLRTGTTSESEALSFSDSSSGTRNRLHSRTTAFKAGNGNKVLEKASSKTLNGRSTIRAKSQSQAYMVKMSQQQIVRSMSVSTVSDDDSDAPPLGDENTETSSLVDTAVKAKRRKVLPLRNPPSANGARTTRAAAKGRDGKIAVAKEKAPTERIKSSGPKPRAGRQAAVVPQTRPVQSAGTSGETDEPQPPSQRTIRR